MSKTSHRIREFLSVDGLTVAGIALLTVFVIGLAALLVILDKQNSKDNGQKTAAILAGVTHVKEQCIKEDVSADICSSITGEASKAPCDQKSCWLVYTHSNKSEHVATVAVQENNNSEFTVVNYRRTPDTQAN